MADDTPRTASDSPPSTGHTARPEGDRLGSWKVIAAYLRRSVRTVRRWEEREDLPIHRHKHEKGSTVFAFKSELDRWQGERQEQAAVEPAPEPSSSEETPTPNAVPVQHSRLTLAAGLVLGAIGAALAAWMLAAYGTGAGARTMAPLRVLLADVESESAEPAWGDRLQSLLQAVIINEPRLDSVPRARQEETLALMRRPAGTAVRAAIAREIGVRDSLVGAVITARVYDRGGVPAAEIEIFDPALAVTVRSISGVLEHRQDLEREVRRLAEETRDLLLSEPPAPRLVGLPRATTSSLTALRLLAHGDRQLRQGRPTAAAVLYRQALKEDPALALAQIQLARALAVSSPGSPEGLAAAERAEQLGTDTSLRERHLIDATGHELEGDTGLAQAGYRALASLEPGDYWAARGLRDTCRQLEPNSLCVDQVVRLAEVAPDDFGLVYEAAWALSLEGSDTATARALTRQAVALLPGVEEEDAVPVLLELFSAQRSWLGRDTTRAADLMDGLTKRLERSAAVLPDRILADIGQVALTLGRIEQATQWFEAVADPIERHELLALTLWAGSKDRLRPHLVREGDYSRPLTVGLLAMAGLGEQAERLATSLAPAASAGELEVTRGILAFFEGLRDKSMEELSLGLSRHATESDPIYFMGTDLLAMNHVQRGDLDRAVGVLEPTTGRRARAMASGSGMLWIMCQSNLAALYREADRETDAVEIERELLRLLSRASSDHPLVRELRARQTGVVS